MGGTSRTDTQEQKEQTLIDQMLAATDSSSKNDEATKQPHNHDVLCGRGGLTNHHVGNVNFRKLVAFNKKLYASSPKRQKIVVSLSIMESIRRQDPPGRFLQRDGKTGVWYDIGRKKALHKTSQALREGGVETLQAHGSSNSISSGDDDSKKSKKRVRDEGWADHSREPAALKRKKVKNLDSPTPSPAPVSDCEDDERSIHWHTGTLNARRISCDSTCTTVASSAETAMYMNPSFQVVAASPPPPILLEPTPFFSKRRQHSRRRVSKSDDFDNDPIPLVDGINGNKDLSLESLPSWLERAFMDMEDDGTTIDNILPLGIDFGQQHTRIQTAPTNPLMDDDDRILMEGLSFFLKNS